MRPGAGLRRGDLRIRFICCMVVVAACFAGLGTRMFYLQVIKGRSYRYQSENNRVRAERIAPPRGMVLDARGEILADTHAAFETSICAVPGTS